MLVIEVRDIVQQDPVRLWAFLANLNSDAYKSWHPEDHVSFKRLRPPTSSNGVGQIVRFKERIGKHMYSFTCIVTASTPGEYVEFKPSAPLSLLRLGGGYFKLKRINKSDTELIAVVELGWNVPIIGPLLDFVIEKIVDLEALRIHMREESHYIEHAAAARSEVER